MKPALLRDTRSSTRFRLMLVVVLLAGMTLAGLLLGSLRSDQEDSHRRVELALGVVNSVRLIDGLEWRARAGANPAEIDRMIATANTQLLNELAELKDGPEARILSGKATAYARAVTLRLSTSFADDGSGLDEDTGRVRVDPGFREVISRAQLMATAQAEMADYTARKVALLTWAILLTLLVAIGTLVARVSKSRERDLRLRFETDQRFRTLVEGSEDVVTVVTGIEELSVLSPTLGPFARSGSGPWPTSMGGLLTSAALSDWRVIDNRLRNHGGHHTIEVTLERTDSMATQLEGHGSLLASDSSQRVWVWRDITERKELELQLSHQAFHDSLTGVANRSLLYDRVDHALAVSVRTDKPVTVLFCDLDDFKSINDSLGHGYGDELLQIITKRIQSCVRETDTVARLGGDEFAVLLEDATGESALALSERILSVVSFEAELADQVVFPSISIGIATAVPGTTTAELFRNADLAMYSAKRAGRGRAEIYQDEMHESTIDRLELQVDLKEALVGGQFTVHYQPSVDLQDGNIEGFEALIRWAHPTRGNVPPDQFIPIAEATGQIVEIGRWVLGEACRAAVQLQVEHVRPLQMAVNLSPQQLRDPTIVATVKDALDDSGLQPDRLVLEVTEGFLLDNPAAVARLHELRALGVLIAIDDFGTGYTSINYLQSLPISILKIDRAFISGNALAPAERKAFLHAIVGLAKSLNLRLIAEGVEDEIQRTELSEAGCDTGQGFLWSPATPLIESSRLIAQIQSPSVGIPGVGAR